MNRRDNTILVNRSQKRWCWTSSVNATLQFCPSTHDLNITDLSQSSTLDLGSPNLDNFTSHLNQRNIVKKRAIMPNRSFYSNCRFMRSCSFALGALYPGAFSLCLKHDVLYCERLKKLVTILLRGL